MVPEWEVVTTGKSGARVWRGPGVYRKQDTPEKLAGEAARLEWLAQQGLPCPEVVSLDGDVLVTTAVPGNSATEHPRHLRHRLLDAYTDLLQRLHGLAVDECPFDETLATTLPRAERNAREGLVDLADLDDERAGWSTTQLLDALRATRPLREDLVVCHGDPGVANVLFDDSGAVTGVIDVDRLGVADRHRDLAIAVRSIGDHLAPGCSDVLLERYRAGPVHSPLLAFYRLLDEFF